VECGRLTVGDAANSSDLTVEKRSRDVKKKSAASDGSISRGVSIVPTYLDIPQQAY
jgi:hypothetical protein